MRLRAPRRAAPILALPLLAAALVACGLPPTANDAVPVQGSGDVVTEDRTTGDFSHLSVGGGIEVTVTQGAPLSVTLTAQANLLPLIKTAVSDGQLIVNVASPGIRSSEPVTLAVVVPDLQSLTLSGGAHGTLESTRESIVLDVSGGAVLEATGTATSLVLTASGGAQARLGGLVAESATVTASGGCQAELSVVDLLSGEATAGATIRLVRQPATVDVATSSGGMVVGG